MRGSVQLLAFQAEGLQFRLASFTCCPGQGPFGVGAHACEKREFRCEIQDWLQAAWTLLAGGGRIIRIALWIASRALSADPLCPNVHYKIQQDDAQRATLQNPIGGGEALPNEWTYAKMSLQLAIGSLQAVDQVCWQTRDLRKLKNMLVRYAVKSLLEIQ